MKTDEVTRVSFYSHAMLLLTSIHHIYGAIIYQTPWRLHVLMLSVPGIIIIEMLKYFLLKRKNRVTGVLELTFWLVVLVIPIGLIGFFEGFYNHLVKDFLYYTGVTEEFFFTLFPPPTYVIPDDFLFEFTGVSQAVMMIPLIQSFISFTRKHLRTSSLNKGS